MCLSDLIDAIDSPGGHIIGLQVLLYSTAIAVAMGYNIPKAEDIIVGSFGALLAKLSGGLSNSARKNGSAAPKPVAAPVIPAAVEVKPKPATTLPSVSV